MKKKPKYGYARDYFGRIVERDVFDEERRDENWKPHRKELSMRIMVSDCNDITKFISLHMYQLFILQTIQALLSILDKR